MTEKDKYCLVCNNWKGEPCTCWIKNVIGIFVLIIIVLVPASLVFLKMIGIFG